PGEDRRATRGSAGTVSAGATTLVASREALTSVRTQLSIRVAAVAGPLAGRSLGRPSASTMTTASRSPGSTTPALTDGQPATGLVEIPRAWSSSTTRILAGPAPSTVAVGEHPDDSCACADGWAAPRSAVKAASLRALATCLSARSLES